MLERIAEKAILVPVLESFTGESAAQIAARELSSGDLLAQLYAKVRPALAKVETLSTNGEGARYASGTAFSVDAKGRLLTAGHVADADLDLALVDQRGDVHDAVIAGMNHDSDLALLQLTNPRSFEAFTPLKFARDFDGAKQLSAAGFPDMSNRAFISRITQIEGKPAFRAGDSIISSVPTRHGNSGGPLLDSDGAVLGVNVRKMSVIGTHGTWTTDADTATKLISDSTGSGRGWDVVTSSNKWLVTDQSAMRQALEKMFGRGLESAPKTDIGLHVNYGNVHFDDGLSVTMRASTNKAQGLLTIRPVAINQQAITSDMSWGAQIKNSRLTFQLDKNMNPQTALAENDPQDVLRRWIPDADKYMK